MAIRVVAIQFDIPPLSLHGHLYGIIRSRKHGRRITLIIEKEATLVD
jgi:hypothetical protein